MGAYRALGALSVYSEPGEGFTRIVWCFYYSIVYCVVFLPQFEGGGPGPKGGDCTVITGGYVCTVGVGMVHAL